MSYNYSIKLMTTLTTEEKDQLVRVASELFVKQKIELRNLDQIKTLIIENDSEWLFTGDFDKAFQKVLNQSLVEKVIVFEGRGEDGDEFRECYKKGRLPVIQHPQLLYPGLPF